jgi:hypothetical protein
MRLRVAELPFQSIFKFFKQWLEYDKQKIEALQWGKVFDMNYVVRRQQMHKWEPSRWGNEWQPQTIPPHFTPYLQRDRVNWAPACCSSQFILCDSAHAGLICSESI